VPANKKVSVGWQIVFTFLPVINFWAFYRIRRLRRYVLYIIVPQIIMSIVIGAYTSSVLSERFADLSAPESSAFDTSGLADPIIISSYAISIGLQGFTIYLVVIWSRKHNRQYDQPQVQSG
jgi:hypothetical protein